MKALPKLKDSIWFLLDCLSSNIVKSFFYLETELVNKEKLFFIVFIDIKKKQMIVSNFMAMFL